SASLLPVHNPFPESRLVPPQINKKTKMYHPAANTCTPSHKTIELLFYRHGSNQGLETQYFHKPPYQYHCASITCSDLVLSFLLHDPVQHAFLKTGNDQASDDHSENRPYL